jgi:zinc protease
LQLPEQLNPMRMRSPKPILLSVILLLGSGLSSQLATFGRTTASEGMNHSAQNVQEAAARGTVNGGPYSEVRRDTLLNGLQVISLKVEGQTQIQCDLIVRAGSMFDPLAKTGLAGMTQRTLLAVNPRLREEMDSLQSTIEWGWNWDTTWFRLRASPASFEQALEILARLLVVENIRPEAFKVAVEQQLAEIRQPLPLSSRADEALMNALYGIHPYGHNLLGSEATIGTLRPGDVYDYFQRFYLANNASAIVTGPISQGRVLALFKILFGGWSKGAIVPATFRPPLRIPKDRVVVVEQAEGEVVEIRVGLPGEKVTSPSHLTTHLLGEIWAQRWEKSNPATSSGKASVEVSRRTLDGPLYLRAVAPAKEAREAARRMVEMMAGTVANPISVEELAQAKAALGKRWESRTVGEWLQEVETFALPRNWPLTAIPQLAAITEAEVIAAARTLLERNHPAAVLVGRVEEAPKSSP